MAYAAFPPSLSPIIEQQGYGEAPQSDVATFKLDAGAPLLRQRSINPQDLIGITTWLSSEDWDTLKGFHETTLLDGTQPFTWVHPRNLTAATFQFEGDPPKINSVAGPMYGIVFTLRLLSGGEYQPVTLDFDVNSPLQYDSTPGDNMRVE